MAEADVLGRNGLVQATGEDDTALKKTGKELGGDLTLGEIDGSHAVGLVGRVRGKLLEAELGDATLDLLRDGLVACKALGEGAGEDLAQRLVEGVDELGRGSGKVRGLLGLVVLHDWRDISRCLHDCARGDLLGIQFFHEAK